MRREVTIREHEYGYKVTAKGSKGDNYGHYMNYGHLSGALQDAKDYLEGEEKMNKIEVNNKVRVTDISWAMELREGLLRKDPNGASVRNLVWNVVATELKLPTSKSAYDTNDTIIVEAVTKGRVLFITHKYLELINVCPNCGVTI